ncbi:hypothetical protein SEA_BRUTONGASTER_16 [Gordonia phage BrutonGaster]|uniref:Uncharacterized protein n=1 Tax=Gordonia phage BrutonGaster TaxID=2530116 RepID=A0A482JKE6_9CAUD|nr:hypothetical protein HOV26_gp166 [Gordonia phage BrutonGaster]QBP33233.1 hypothetical protein SEA_BRUTONGASTER_16 [Gordonia phage BrutonGaster]
MSDENNLDVYEVSKLSVVRYLGIDGTFFTDVYWEDFRGGDDLTFEEKIALVERARQNAYMSEMDYEIVDWDEDDDDED